MNDKQKYNRDFIYTCPSKVFDDQSLTINELKIYMMIRSFMDTTGEAYPSNNWIANKLNIDRSTAIRSINKLIEKNYIERITINNYRYLRIKITNCPDNIVAQTPPPSGTDATPPSGTDATQLDQSNIRSKNIKRDINAREAEQKEREKEVPIDPDYKYPETYFPTSTQSTDHSLCATNPAGYSLTPSELDTFEQFWNLYPRKTGKVRAKQQWFHDGCHLSAPKILAKLQEQIKKDKSFLDDCVPNPHKYIVEQRYNDEIFEGKKSKGHFDHEDTSWINKRDIFDD